MREENHLLNYMNADLTEAGCDEAGRGPLAGPVFAAAVILPPDFHHPLLNDSKQMTERNRNLLREVIEREAVAWAVQEISAARIDEINILNASFEGMSLAVAQLEPRPQFLAIDGNRFRTSLDIPYTCVVKGDGKYADIAAASVLAKTHRDEYMMRLAEEYPMYGWAKNKGYPTREHRLAVREYGLSPYHRVTFNHEIGQLELF
jgi:ribonuclease HII